MAGSKDFTGNLPRTGRQRSAEQVSARLEDLRGYLNEIFSLSDDVGNYGKVIGFNESTGEVDVFNALTLDTDILADHVVVGDVAPNEGTLIQEWAVIGDDKKYKIGPDGTTGQILTRDALGDLVFTDPPASTNFIDQNGNFTASPNVNYNIEAGAQITIDTVDVVPGFTVRFRPQYNEVFEDNNPVVLYNGVNPFENTTEDLQLDCSLVYTLYSQNGTNLEFSVEGVSSNI